MKTCETNELTASVPKGACENFEYSQAEWTSRHKQKYQGRSNRFLAQLEKLLSCSPEYVHTLSNKSGYSIHLCEVKVENYHTVTEDGEIDGKTNSYSNKMNSLAVWALNLWRTLCHRLQGAINSFHEYLVCN